MKKKILIGIIILIVISCFFPPWKSIDTGRSSNIKAYEPEGYGFLLDPPYMPKRRAVAIDFDRFFIQIGVLLLLGVCVFFSDRIFPKSESSEAPEPKVELTKKKRNWVAITVIGLLFVILIGYGVMVTVFSIIDHNIRLEVIEERNQVMDDYEAIKRKNIQLTVERNKEVRDLWLADAKAKSLEVAEANNPWFIATKAAWVARAKDVGFDCDVNNITKEKIKYDNKWDGYIIEGGYKILGEARELYPWYAEVVDELDYFDKLVDRGENWQQKNPKFNSRFIFIRSSSPSPVFIKDAPTKEIMRKIVQG